MDDLVESLSNASPLRDIIKRALDNKHNGGIRSPALRGLLLNVADYLVGRDELPPEQVEYYVKHDRHFPVPGMMAESFTTSMYADSVYTLDEDDCASSIASSSASKGSSVKYCDCNEPPAREKKPRTTFKEHRILGRPMFMTGPVSSKLNMNMMTRFSRPATPKLQTEMEALMDVAL